MTEGNVPSSHHIFLLPLWFEKWDKTFENKLNDFGWSEDVFDMRNNNLTNKEVHQMYNEYIYFYEFARKALFIKK